MMDRKRVNQKNRRRIEEDEDDLRAFASIKKSKLGTALLDSSDKIVRRVNQKTINRQEFLERIAAKREVENNSSDDEDLEKTRQSQDHGNKIIILVVYEIEKYSCISIT